jgi:hypothetical protein
MQIYDAERLMGLEDKIATANASATLVLPDTDKAQANFVNDHSNSVIEHGLSEDLMSVNGILVTTNWNKNDDVFSPDEVWPARFSPVYKPANLGHMGKESDEENQNIGVIYKSHAVNESYQAIADENELPDKFHLLVSIYLWEKYFPNTTKRIKDGIDNKEMFISMECIFNDFGYALKDSMNKVFLVPRNEKTAWLSSSLRSLGGKGTITVDGKNYKIGRWLRKINFSGVGFVLKPANPESILFNNYVTHTEAETKNFNQIFDAICINSVLSIDKGTFSLWQM